MPIYRYDCMWFPIFGDEVFDKIVRHQPYEHNEIEFVQGFLKKNNVFMDIGANFGLYSIIAAKLVGEEGKVISIEPEPGNLKRLKRNVIFNRISIHIIPLALGETEGLTEFYSCSQAAYSGLKVSDVPGEITKIVVPQTTLDDLHVQFEWTKIDLIKMDVEGAELLVLKGGKDLISKSRPVILMEFSDKRTKAYGYSCSEVYQWLRNCDYEFFEFRTNGKMQKHHKKLDYSYDNLVVCPKEKLYLLNDFLQGF